MSHQPSESPKRVKEMQNDPITISFSKGDGIGPEIMKATISVLDAADAGLQYDEVLIGQELYHGNGGGIPSETWETIRKNKVLLKAPIITPQGGGYKSLTVTLRKTLGLFANVRPVKAYVPFIESHFPKMDVVVVRENEEDLYAAIEHQQTSEVVQCLKLITKPGSERVIRYAFEYARAYNRKKVTCMTKDNIMKLTDGLFHKMFDEISQEYPEIEANHYIIDIGSALLADQPDRFDLVVTPNLYGDIISDITAQVSGSVGMGGSANVGVDVAMFEAVHGSAPDIAGKGIANPSGLLQAAALMLVHLGKPKIAEKIQNALLKTLEDGIHTADIYNEAFTRQKVNTQEFAQAVIERLGQQPKTLQGVHFNEDLKPITIKTHLAPPAKKRLLGADVFLDWVGEDRDPNVLGEMLEELAGDNLQLKMITNRGVKVYPNGQPETFCTDHWRCRFVSTSYVASQDPTEVQQVEEVPYKEVTSLLNRLTDAGLNFIKLENLYEIDGKRAFSLGQGE